MEKEPTVPVKPVKVSYVVFDLVDPAAKRRIGMLERGGAAITLLGFRRSAEPPAEVAGLKPVDLGRTYPAALVKRALSVVKAMAGVWRLRPSFAGADVVIARNLECLPVAALARRLYAPKSRFVYECLDIHRVMLDGGLKGRIMRWIERRLLAAVDGVVISSPAFAESYFGPYQNYGGPFVLVENKVYGLPAGTFAGRHAADLPDDGTPPKWRIGWFGVIRCQKSLDLLTALADALNGKVEVVIRGRVALHEFRDFHGDVAASPHVRFEGEYAYPGDLPAIYGEVHFAWAIDYFEAGLNSVWLLPNRLYECGSQGAVAIADAHVETGRWLERHDLGVRLDKVEVPALVATFEAMTADRWRAMSEAVLARPIDTFVVTDDDCHALMSALAHSGH